MISSARRTLRPLVPLSHLFALLAAAGCQVDDDPSDAGPASDMGGCTPRPARGDAQPRDCYVPLPDAAQPFGNGVTIELVNASDEPLDHLVLGASMGHTVSLWVGGWGVDGSGCPANFRTGVEQVEGVLNLQVWHDLLEDRGCNGLTSQRTTVEFPALAAGEYTVRLRTGGCTDRGCSNEVQGPPTVDVPLSVLP